MEKHFISAAELLEDSFRLASRVLRSGFRPDCIIGIWRGGTPVAIAVQEYLAFKGIPTRHFAIATRSYTGIAEQSTRVTVLGMEQFESGTRPDDALLLVDDVFDSGRSMQAVVEQIGTGGGRDIRIACPWYKPKRNVTSLVPDFHLHETDDWLVFPHELAGLSSDEIRQGKQDLAAILDLLELG